VYGTPISIFPSTLNSLDTLVLATNQLKIIIDRGNTHDSTPGSINPACAPTTHPLDPTNQKKVEMGAANQSNGIPITNRPV
jgi:hypothetical protein